MIMMVDTNKNMTLERGIGDALILKSFRVVPPDGVDGGILVVR